MDDLLQDKLLNQLVEKLRQAFGARLISVVLYGSAAVGDTHGAYSDLNVLVLLDRVTAAELGASRTVFEWWRGKDNPAPMLMSVDEMRRSTDCFPIEFHDMVERRRVLFGEDVIATLELDDVFYRAQVEHDVRAKLLRLRQKAAGVLDDAELLRRLMCDSVATFCVLARHALRLAVGSAPHDKRAVVAQMKTQFGIEGRAFDMLLSLREGRVRARDVKPEPLFAVYLEEISALAAAVDRLER
jgi:predicted nucleotidyltransferase